MQFIRIAIIYLIVAVIAGGIAYLGNFMGKKIGRRKMTVFGLRPKHTSNLITALTGSLIAVTTLTLFAVASDEVRQLLGGLEARRSELRELQDKIVRERQRLSETQIICGVGQTVWQSSAEPHQTYEQNIRSLRGVLGLMNAYSIEANNKLAISNGEAGLPENTQLIQCSDEQVEAFAKQLATADRVVGVQLIADRNCLYKDPIPVHFKQVSVTRVFAKGEVVVSHSLPVDESQLILEWSSFLAQIRQAALRRGMIEWHDSLEVVAPQELERLSEELRRIKGPKVAVAIAQMDLYQTSKLAVKVEVRPASHTGYRTDHRQLASRHKNRR